MAYEGALYVPSRDAYVVSVVLLLVCDAGPCVLSITVMGGVYLTLVVLR